MTRKKQEQEPEIINPEDILGTTEDGPQLPQFIELKPPNVNEEELMQVEENGQIKLPGFEVESSPNWETSKEPPAFEDLVNDKKSVQVSDQVSDQVSNQVKAIDGLDVPALAMQQCALPLSLQASAETSVDLRKVQRRLANILTQEKYVDAIAAYRPEVLPELFNSITGGIATADNLQIKFMQEASKNATMNRMLDRLTEPKRTNTEDKDNQQDQYYDESIEKIKKAIFHKLDEDRLQGKKKTAQDFIDPRDTEVIDADYTEQEDTEDGNNQQSEG